MNQHKAQIKQKMYNIIKNIQLLILCLIIALSELERI